MKDRGRSLTLKETVFCILNTALKWHADTPYAISFYMWNRNSLFSFGVNYSSVSTYYLSSIGNNTYLANCLGERELCTLIWDFTKNCSFNTKSPLYILLLFQRYVHKLESTQVNTGVAAAGPELSLLCRSTKMDRQCLPKSTNLAVFNLDTQCI